MSPSPEATPEITPEPVCTDDACPHIGLDDNGDPVALCPVGALMLAGETKSAGRMLLRAAPSAATSMHLRNGDNTIYRSGTYVLTGGGDGARLDVARGTAVVLRLSDARLLTLSLRDGVVAVIAYDGQNQVSTIAAPGASITFDGRGCLYGVNNINASAMSVRGGSVTLPSYAVSDNARTPYTFSASGASSATVDGEAFPFTAPRADDGTACLWLPAPSGAAYTASVVGGVLTVTSLPPEPPASVDYDLSAQSSFAPVAGTAYRIIAAGAPLPQTLNVGVTGVSLSLGGVSAHGVSISTSEALDMSLSGENRLSDLTATARLSISGSGGLELDNLNAPELYAQGALTVMTAAMTAIPNGWLSVAADGELGIGVTALYQESRLPLLFTASDKTTAYLPLPAPLAGRRYSASLKGNELIISEVPDGDTPVTLTDAGITLTSGSYALQSEGAVSGSISIENGATVALTLSDARTSGRLVIGDGASVTLTLVGSSRVAETALGGGASLSVNGGGALLSGTMSGGAGCSTTVAATANLSLASGEELPGSALKPTVISVTDINDAPVSGKQITLKLGTQAPFDAVTSHNGRVTIWQSAPLTDVDAVVLSDADTYAAVVKGGKAEPDALPVIRDLSDTSYGAISFTTDVATQKKGVMYKVAGAECELPDAFTSDASFAALNADGICELGGLNIGDVVTYRAYASVAGAELSEANQDAFAFSEKRVLTVTSGREAFSLKKQTKTYDGKRFNVKSSLLPSGSSVEYLSNGTVLSAAPRDVGSYVARVTVPSGNPVYLPGAYDVDMSIERIKVVIYPDELSKQKGEADPPLTFMYDDSVMLDDDEVTGYLSRRKGEYYGNYEYYINGLKAKPYYRLVLDEEAPSFFIDWNAHHYMPFDPLAVIDPVYDEVRLSSGGRLRVQIRTGEKLSVSDYNYGSPVTDTEDGKARPFTPTLRVLGGYDSALLILTAEPELNDDGGYATDADGNRLVRGRKLTISHSMLNRLGEQNIDYIAFSLEGVTAVVPLKDLRAGGAVDSLIKRNDMTRIGMDFTVTLEPIGGADALTPDELSANDAARLGNTLMRVSVALEKNDTVIDVAPALRSAAVSFDASPLMPEPEREEQSDVIETVAGKPVQKPAENDAMRDAAIAAARGEGEATDELMLYANAILSEQLAKNGYALNRYGATAEALKTKAIVPYTDSEKANARFNALMRTKPYLTAELKKSGLYGIAADEDR